LGKGLVVSVDKFTAVKMYEKVQYHWKIEIKNLTGRISKLTNDIEKVRLKKVLDFMLKNDMAVVISLENSDAETERFAKQGLDLKPHRDRLNLESLLATNDTFKYLEQFKQFANVLLQKDELRKTFNVYENTISSLYEACKPEILSNRRPLVFVFQYLRGVINSIIERTNIDSIDLKISELLDRSVVAEDNTVSQAEYTAEYKILPTGKILDLSKIDYDKLKTEFKLASYKNIQIADLRSFIENKLDRMLQQNTTRTDIAKLFAISCIQCKYTQTTR
jgi:Domain of unknown function (DUF3387)